MRKYYGYILFFIVLALGVVYAMVYPTAKNLSGCFLAAKLDVEANIIRSSEENWDNATACYESKITINQLDSCIKSVDNKSFVKTETIFKITRVFNKHVTTIESLMDVYNKFCTQ